jgi:hypothetical protein
MLSDRVTLKRRNAVFRRSLAELQKKLRVTFPGSECVTEDDVKIVTEVRRLNTWGEMHE